MEFSLLHTLYPRFFDHLERTGEENENEKKAKRYKYDNAFYMSIDAEWYEHGGRNIVLSYQIATTSRSKTNNIIKYMEHSKRLALAEIIELGIQSVTTPESFAALRSSKIIVVLISHNFVAEWSVLADRDEASITKRLALVRSSPITDGHAIKMVTEKSLQVDVLIYDTMLLAPASHRGLKKLSSLLGDKEKEKDPITQFHIEHMNLYLQDHPERFRAYALKDSEVTLRLFFKLQGALNNLVGGDTFKLYRTLASAGVTGYLNENEWYDAYQKSLRRSDAFFTPYQLVKRSYYGGRNESYFIGHTADCDDTKDKIWLDIDFSGAYPTSMALCPKLDISGIVDYIPYTHELSDEKEATLLAENIDQKIITTVRAALNISPEEFDRALAEIPSKKSAWKIRQVATKVDNRLINKWYGAWKDAQITGDTSIEGIMVAGFARVRFTFPPDTEFPCLPIRHDKFGLLYVLQGETTATATEIILAMESGATIEALTSVELPIERDEQGEPVRFVLEHLKKLTLERRSYQIDKKNDEHQVREKLIKEFTNSFYGKFSQSINPRNVYKPATGEMVELGKSNLTEPCTAALVTSLARAALSATLIGIERFNKGKLLKDQITVISVTTDGLLIGIPSNRRLKEVKRYYKYKDGIPKMKEKAEKILLPILKKLECNGLMDEINRFLPIRQMRNSRKEMTGSCEIFEIKHMADQIVSIKTRGQVGLLNSGHTSLLARFGHKPPLSELIADPEKYKLVMESGGVVRDTEDTKWIVGHINRINNGLDKIEKYTFITLTSFRKMIQSKGTMDLVKQTSKRNINMDFDWKRKLTWEDAINGERPHKISPFTVPHRTVTEMLLHRNQMEAIRRAGYIARPEKVLHRLQIKGRTVRYRGGEPVTVARLFVRGVLNGKIPVSEVKETQLFKAAKMNQIWVQSGLIHNYDKVWSVNDFKNNDKRSKWEPGCILPNSILEDLVQQLAVAFHADPVTAQEAIFAIEEFEATHTRLIEQVISATVHAPLMGIEPFVSLQQKGLLPTLRRIRDTFSYQLSDEEINFSIKRAFIPGQLPAGDTRKLKKLFYSLGIPHIDAAECAKTIAAPIPPIKKTRRNPGEKKCTDHFTLAILQSDINVAKEDLKGLWGKLHKFGLSRNRYYELKKSGNFRPNGISDTHTNRQQIQKMAKALELDPVPFIKILIST